MEKHITLLGWLFIIFNFISFLTTSLAMHLFIPPEGRFIAHWVTFGMFVISAPGIAGGIGLLKRKYWAKILVLVLGFINLLHFPFGTALGIYTIWLLTRKETAEFFTGKPFQYQKTPA
ncbi:MAG: hypothetical protein ACRECJ_06550 [Limisphaerales bacterium]